MELEKANFKFVVENVTSRHFFIGIDPGITGAVAGISQEGNVSLDDTPVHVKSGKKTEIEYLPAAMAAIFSGYDSTTFGLGKACHAHVFIEDTIPATFGLGIWIGILATLQIPYILVTPQSWKKEMMQGIKTYGKHWWTDEISIRKRAKELFPKSRSELSRKKDIGRANALLIAEYGRRILERRNYEST